MPTHKENYVTFHANNFLASPEGKEMIARVFNNNDPIRKHLETVAAHHEKVMNAMGLSLDDDHPLLNAAQVPLNAPTPPQSAPNAPVNQDVPNSTKIG